MVFLVEVLMERRFLKYAAPENFYSGSNAVVSRNY